jgi:enoyl-CoA hydratase
VASKHEGAAVGVRPVETERRNDALVLTLNRPHRRNALDNDALRALGDALADAQQAHARVLLLEGAGGTFCAGSDIKEMAAGGRGYRREHVRLGQDVFAALERLPALTVALVDGYALGGGVELALACDVRLALADSVWGFPEVALGAIPSWGGTQRLPRFVGLGVAKRLLLTGERLEARALVGVGLVDSIYDTREELDEAGAALAARAAEFPPHAFRLVKELVLASFDAPAAVGAFAERVVDELADVEPN